MTGATSEATFEQLLQELDETVRKLEDSELSLEDAIATYEKSVELAAACAELLDNAELRIRQIDTRIGRLRNGIDNELDTLAEDDDDIDPFE